MRILLGRANRSPARFIARALREDAYAVDLAASGEEVFAACQGVAYAAVLLHSDLPSLEGGSEPGNLDLCRKLRSRQIRTPILLLQAGAIPSASRLPPAGGATDVLFEPFALGVLRRRLGRLIRAASGGPGALAPTAPIGWAGLALDPRTRCARRDRQEFPLTRKEYALLELLLLRAPHPVTHADIVAQVWDGDFACDSNLIEVYMMRLRKRIDGSAGVKLLHTVRGIGYRVGTSKA